MPRPLYYEIELRVTCGASHYSVVVETRGFSTSRLVSSTSNGVAAEFQSTSGDLANVVSGMAVTRITPNACDARSGTISLSVDGYDPRLDAVEGETGEVNHLFNRLIPVPEGGGL